MIGSSLKVGQNLLLTRNCGWLNEGGLLSQGDNHWLDKTLVFKPVFEQAPLSYIFFFYQDLRINQNHYLKSLFSKKLLTKFNKIRSSCEF